MKRVRFNDVVEVRYFKKNKPIHQDSIKKHFYRKASIVFFLFLILLILINMTRY